MISDVCGFQHNARLSLPQERRRSASCLHHDSESTPFSWPVKICENSSIDHRVHRLKRRTFSGARALRRSQTIMTGDMSSSEDVTRRVACRQKLAGSHEDHEKTHVIRMPLNVAHTPPSTNRQSRSAEALQACLSTRTAAVCKCRNLSLSSQIPYHGVASATRCGESVLDVIVPCERRYLVELRASGAWRVGLAWVLQVPDVDL